jgi:ribosomal protein S18 acetylase RimI-like enzyme
MNSELVLRNMIRAELDELVEWAALEGWNPGLHDADAYWATDPEAFIAAELKGDLIGGGAITAYGDDFGFMGFFIIKPEHRGQGYGNVLWLARRDRLKARLRPGATIGMDGVFDMEPYYAKGGFVRSHRDLRYSGNIAPLLPEGQGDGIEILPIDRVPFDDWLDYDRRCFPSHREKFLRAWRVLPESLAFAARRHGRLSGYGVIRRCRDGYRVGPLFADDQAVARRLLSELSAFAAQGLIYLDVPENNPEALALVQALEMEEVFGCARMYLGPFPALEHRLVFGVTTLELG